MSNVRSIISTRVSLLFVNHEEYLTLFEPLASLSFAALPTILVNALLTPAEGHVALALNTKHLSL
jgi:hypothetical protein